ncbi:hypothetical protein LX99_04819 [Mucilaginibacter oryzae]|uniref:Uncharacterized protein n=1 Tax=Mucilaginibacter oryzae TaxID=468058 RepID=A0A316GV15_9SPHI|nr:hypothetical protein LX99_04819 [Mucilaginibacter oryzae]
MSYLSTLTQAIFRRIIGPSKDKSNIEVDTPLAKRKRRRSERKNEVKQSLDYWDKKHENYKSF